jgi:cysteine desulfurase
MLYKRKKLAITPLIVGGDQEHLIRAGTENIALIAGFAYALQKVTDNGEQESIRLRDLQRYFMLEIKKRIPQLRFNGHAIHRLPNNIHLSIPAVEGESMLLMLDQYGIEASTGSACSALDLRPSHVLSAIGQHPDIIHGSIRFSLGKYTTKEELDTVLEIFPSIVERLTHISSAKLNHGNQIEENNIQTI